jgi:hypothetical protein
MYELDDMDDAEDEQCVCVHVEDAHRYFRGEYRECEVSTP